MVSYAKAGYDVFAMPFYTLSHLLGNSVTIWCFSEHSNLMGKD